jgi:hypothetical protein
MEKVDIVASQMLQHIERVEANRRGHIVAELTALSFLLDHQIATLPELEKRMQQVRHILPERYQDGDVTKRVEFLIDSLRHVYGPKPHGWTPRVIEGGLSRDQTDDPVE